MKINFMMFLIATSFFVITGLMLSQAYVSHEAVNAGLQQCRTGSTVIWQKECL